MPPIPDWIVPTGGLGGILAFLTTALVRGWLSTKTHVDRISRQYEEEIKRLDGERLEWREIALKGIDVNSKTAPTLNAVLEGQEAIKSLLLAFRKPPGGGSDE